MIQVHVSPYQTDQFPSAQAAWDHWLYNFNAARHAFNNADNHYQRKVALDWALRCIRVLRDIRHASHK